MQAANVGTAKCDNLINWLTEHYWKTFNKVTTDQWINCIENDSKHTEQQANMSTPSGNMLYSRPFIQLTNVSGSKNIKTPHKLW